MGEGKGWARGKTAATDPRVSHAAAAHRGLTYRRHVSVEQDGRYRGAGARTLELEWSPAMAYVVGLLATDGCLISDGRHLSFKSADEQLVCTFLECLGRPLTYRRIAGRTGNTHFEAQFSDVQFWRWLGTIGVTPTKSLVLGALAVPDGLTVHCARGLLDGDGSILDYWYDGTGKARGGRYEALVTVFNSASRSHLEWLRERLGRQLGVMGALVAQPPKEHRAMMWRLAYAIRESTRLLPHLYASADAPCLLRKRLVWEGYARRHSVFTSPSETAETEVPYRCARSDPPHSSPRNDGDLDQGGPRSDRAGIMRCPPGWRNLVAA
ncbi:MAG: hypothetical protein KGK34_02040 [Chloroflexota bacterium]|nr:hypothetical protein [Chloroflexota bacterium]